MTPPDLARCAGHVHGLPRIGRREFLGAVTKGAIVLTAAPATAQATDPAVPALPDPRRFEPGDLLWPKHRDTYIPFNARSASHRADQADWEQHKRAFIDAELTRPGLSGERRKGLLDLDRLTFDEFERLYFGDELPGDTVPFGGTVGRVTRHVGHVAILFLSSAGEPWIVEGVSPRVRKMSYPAWLEDRARHQMGEWVWHGRVQPLGRADRDKMVTTALSFVDRPYAIFSHVELTNEQGFYCSKLVWYSVFRTTGLRLAEPSLKFPRLWFSPKQLIASEYVCLLHNPGRYADGTRPCPPGT